MIDRICQRTHCPFARMRRTDQFRPRVEELEDRVTPANLTLYAVGTDVGTPAEVRVYNQFVLRFVLHPFGSFAGGVRVATGDLTGDGVDDIVAAAGPGSAPVVKAFDGVTGALIRNFTAYPANFTGGVFVAVGDINHDGIADIVTGPGAGSKPEVKVFSGATGAVIRDFLAYDPGFTGGVTV